MVRDSSEERERRLAVLEAHMRWLMGNGQPGKIASMDTALINLREAHAARIGEVEKKADSARDGLKDLRADIKRYFAYGMGALAMLHFLEANGLLSVAKILGH